MKGVGTRFTAQPFFPAEEIIDGLADERAPVLDAVGDQALANLDIREGAGEAGMAQNLAEEGWAAVDLLSSPVERARFGLPTVARTVLVPGAWRDEWSAPKAAGRSVP